VRLRNLFIFIVFIWPSLGHTSDVKDTRLTIGEKNTIYSNILGEERHYWVSLPKSYYDKKFAPKTYPVVYLLDGEAYFHSVSGMINQMSSGTNGNYQIPEVILVAVVNTNRLTNMTPTKSLYTMNGGQHEGFKISGGANQFLSFFEKELFKEIESSYRVSSHRTMIGHSFGGLVVLHSLLERPKLFQSYIALDPSVWWDRYLLVDQITNLKKDDGSLNGEVYIAAANNSHSPKLTDKQKQFEKGLQRFHSSTFRTEYQYFEKEDHGSVPLIGIYYGLLHNFGGYQIKMTWDDISIAGLNEHFAKYSSKLGVEMLPPESLVNDLGIHFFGGLPNKAIEFFRLNVANYPQSYNAYYYLAESLFHNNQKTLALKNYKVSLKLNPSNENARQKLEKLKEYDK